jgi:ribose-phosphate pyrophosphokinase
MHPLWMLDNCKDIYPTKKVENLYSLTKSDVLCYPDKGAVTKYKTLYKHNYIFGEKVRDSSTGIITDYKIQGTIKGQKILIVDDICDGGMTFILLADKLLSEGALEINLFVTHGIFSKGLACLKAAGIGRIFTNKGEAFERSNSIVYKEIEQCVK